jgi:hypothetical protein
MKKFIKLFLMIFVMIISFTFSINTSADTGPKPYVEITINGDTKGMYMTLLSDTYRRGPHHVYDEEYYNYTQEDDLIGLKFIEYKDKDYFHYLQTYSDISNNKYRWGYYPPTKFKILIYDSINDKFITDDVIYIKEEFGSIYTLTLSDTINVVKEPGVDRPAEDVNNSFVVEKNSTIGRGILAFFTRLIICLAIELLLALLFGFRKLELIPILIVNIVTQVLFNLFLTIYIYFNGFQLLLIIPAYIFFELLIFVSESISNTYFIKLVDKKTDIEIKSSERIVLYTLVANIASLVLGFIIISFFH